ncbi:hypothetical protein [Actinomadura viridis]|uniref:hypothetical protein n=1 Tax=Actinomadura viridis TaxID=58110 RepID=UPI0031EC162F
MGADRATWGGFLDVLPADFDPLERVTSRDEGLPVRSLLDSVLSVREWDLRREDGAANVEQA